MTKADLERSTELANKIIDLAKSEEYLLEELNLATKLISKAQGL